MLRFLRWRPYLIASALALLGKVIIFLLSPQWSKGMGLHLWPNFICLSYGFRDERLDTVSLVPYGPPIAGIRATFMNADMPTYFTPFFAMRDCFQSQGASPQCVRELCAHFRLPGYGIWAAVAGVIRRLLHEDQIYRPLTLLQVGIGVIASVFFGMLIQNLTGGGTNTLYISTFLYSSFPFIARYDFTLGSEGLYSSFLVFSLWALYKAQKGHALWSLFTGILLLEATLLRPITAPLFALYPAALLRRADRFYTIALLLSPWVAFESFWVPCKYYHFKKVVFISHTLIYEESSEWEWMNVKEFLAAFGDNYYWLYYPGYTLPARAYTSRFGKEALDSLYQLERDFYLNFMDESRVLLLEKRVVDFLKSWINDIRREKPWLYYIGSRFYATANFFTGHLQESFHYTPPLKAGLLYTLIYSYSALLWISWIGLGLVGSLYYLLKWRAYPFEAVVSLAAHYAWGGYVILGWIDSRYFLFPLILFGVIAFRFIKSDEMGKYLVRKQK